jgi:hypothetical protein
MRSDGDSRSGRGPISTLRRRFLASLVGIGAGTALVGAGTAEGDASELSTGRGTRADATDPAIRRRLQDEFDTRRTDARVQLVAESDASGHASNERLATDRVVSKYGKGLEHTAEGLPTTAAYDSLVAACEAGEGYDDIERSPEADRPLVQPETAYSYLAEGASTAGLRIAVPPAFDSREAGAEMVELYWRALTRDVNFRDYEENELVAAAAAELDGLDAYRGPGTDGTVTPANVFRGVTPGSETGPYVSQFLWKDLELGARTVRQTLNPQSADDTPRDYLTEFDEWLAVQRGVAPPASDDLPTNEFASEARYIVTGRDMCERVHDDPPFRQVQKAAQILLFGMDAPLDPGVPYTLKPFDGSDPGSRRNAENFFDQTTLPFNDFGPLYVEKKVLEAAEHGQKAAWHKKWNVHRRLRPEEYGGRIHRQRQWQAEREATDSGGGANGDGGSDGDSGDGGAGSGGNGDGDDGGDDRGSATRDGDGSGDSGGTGDGDPGSGGNDGGPGNDDTGGSDGGGTGDGSGDGGPFPSIPDTVLSSEALARTEERYGSALLPQAYAEGSPTHPSYPAGHSVVAGAGVTVLKALFDGDYVFPPGEKVVPTRDGSALRSAAETDAMGVREELTVRGELNKLASNMALGRNRAGIHYRSDGIDGLRLGEAAAVRFLEDQLTHPVAVAGDVRLSFESFDGEDVTVTPTTG